MTTECLIPRACMFALCLQIATACDAHAQSSEHAKHYGKHAPALTLASSLDASETVMMSMDDLSAYVNLKDQQPQEYSGMGPGCWTCSLAQRVFQPVEAFEWRVQAFELDGNNVFGLAATQSLAQDAFGPHSSLKLDFGMNREAQTGIVAGWAAFVVAW